MPYPKPAEALIDSARRIAFGDRSPDSTGLGLNVILGAIYCIQSTVDHVQDSFDGGRRRAGAHAVSTPLALDLSLPEGLPQELARGLEDAIVFRDLAPGARLVEEEIATRFAISRSPVREAIRILEARGLVLREARRGSRVTALSRHDLDEVYACRIELEGLAAAAAAGMRGPADRERLDERIEWLAAAREHRDDREFLRASMALSRAIHEASHNRTLIRLLSTLEPQAMRYRFLAYARAAELMDASLEGNRAVAAASPCGRRRHRRRRDQAHDSACVVHHRTRRRRRRRHRGAGGVSDVVSAAVIRESFASIVREMRRAVARSSYSSIIYEGYDFSCVLVDAAGRLVAQSGEDHPFHIIPVVWSVRGLIERGVEIDEDTLYLHNDPYTGGTHLNDVAVVYPLFHEGTLLFHIVIRAHWADIGGMTPGSLSGAAREILQEGLRLDLVPVPKSGRSPVMDLIFDNVRVSREAVADFHAVIGTCRVAERRLRAVIERYGPVEVIDAVDAMIAAAERRMRAAIAELPDGTYRYTAYLDGNDEAHFPLAVEVALAVAGDTAEADFAGTSPQVAAPLNAGPAIAPTSVLIVLKSFLDPAGVINSGTLRANPRTRTGGHHSQRRVAGAVRGTQRGALRGRCRGHGRALRGGARTHGGRRARNVEPHVHRRRRLSRRAELHLLRVSIGWWRRIRRARRQSLRCAPSTRARTCRSSPPRWSSASILCGCCAASCVPAAVDRGGTGAAWGFGARSGSRRRRRDCPSSPTATSFPPTESTADDPALRIRSTSSAPGGWSRRRTFPERCRTSRSIGVTCWSWRAREAAATDRPRNERRPRSDATWPRATYGEADLAVYGVRSPQRRARA